MAKGKAKKTVAKKVVKKAAAKKTVVKKSAKKKSVAKKTLAAKTAPKKSVAKKATIKKAAVKKAMIKKPMAKKPAAKKLVAKKPVKAPAAKKVVTQSAPMKKVDLSQMVTPLDDRVLVQLMGVERRTAGGLYIPDTVADVSGNLQGFVVAIGRGHRNRKGMVRPMDLKVGDKVLFSEYAGTKIKIEDQDLLILREGDVLGVVS